MKNCIAALIGLHRTENLWCMSQKNGLFMRPHTVISLCSMPYTGLFVRFLTEPLLTRHLPAEKAWALTRPAFIPRALCGPARMIHILDIRKFFYSIDRGVLKKQIERKIKDCRFVDVMMMFAQMETPVGIPIGNLLSQIYALIYMDPVDHFIKRVLKIKHYVRYVDDFILVGITRDQCLVFREKIICFLKEILAIELSKSTIQKVKKGLNFVGYRTWKNKKFIRKYSLYKFKRMVKKNNQEAVVSILGHAKYTNSLPYMLNILKETKNDIKIPKNYRRLYYTHAYRA
jgi:RNA-directed DNA polymerase